MSAHTLDETALEDLQAIRRIKGGHMDGLETLMQRYQLKAARAAFLIIHDQAAAQDLVQDLFLRLYQRVHQFDETYPFAPYLMRSVINASLNAVRGTRRLTSLDGDTEDMEALLDRAASVESQVEFVQLQQEILKALSRLSPRQRAVIVQRYYLGMSEKEMALQLDVASGTVKWLLNAARDRLRGMLGQKGEPSE